ncbi:hypothetical protein DYBT9275_00682 [Dyadobacter sp. CECT 9275]|uniref:NlpC/P60 domain-containing protein n=1 Tax=Dyadobacter helix TaxID=2822344 RepID=A0A916NJU1_9BACT|nr:C40 family peptidase [Dyadobacter sp. CECT 9275]CAG4991109.1 hypothetical protein DYBT9275_00682 [Dyadobacter sp. CECT 9275]
MRKQIFPYFLYLFTLSILITSCDTLRKTPSKESSPRSGRNSKSRSSGSTASARPSSRPPARPGSGRSTTPPKKNNTPPVSGATYTRPAVPYSAEVAKVIDQARTYTGTPYRSGGNDKNGIDCSGLICSVYAEIGVKVPRISWQQSEFGKEINAIQEIQPGDWVFFVPEAGKEGYVSHAGIVTDVRSDQEIIFIHASTSRGVREDNLFSTYFKGRFVKAMRPF